MLKRIQKRVERKEREVQPAKGKKAVEAEDSASGSEQGEGSGSDEGQGDSEEEEEDEDDRSELMSMSGEEDSDEDDDDDEEDDEAQGDEDEEDEDMSEDDEDAPPVSLDDALSKPIYSLQAATSDGSEEEEGDKGEGSSGPKRKLQACILCPQKLFKNEKMAEDHLKSKSHVRSRVRFAQRLLDPDNLTSDDPRDIVLDILEDLESKKASKAAEDDEKKEKTSDEKKADQGKKRKWKEEAKVAKEARREAKRSKPDARETKSDVEMEVTETTPTEVASTTKPVGKMNREARRMEQLLESLGKENRAAFEPTLKGKKGKDKVKAILEEKKRVEGTTAGATGGKKGAATPGTGKDGAVAKNTKGTKEKASKTKADKK